MPTVQLSIDVLAGLLAFIAAVIYIARLEGRINVITAILDRLEEKVDKLQTRGDSNDDYLQRLLHHRIIRPDK